MTRHDDFTRRKNIRGEFESLLIWSAILDAQIRNKIIAWHRDRDARATVSFGNKCYAVSCPAPANSRRERRPTGASYRQRGRYRASHADQSHIARRDHIVRRRAPSRHVAGVGRLRRARVTTTQRIFGLQRFVDGRCHLTSITCQVGSADDPFSASAPPAQDDFAFGENVSGTRGLEGYVGVLSASRTDMPSRFNRAIVEKFPARGASPIEGSSSRRRRGRDMSARPIASICCSPPERSPARCRSCSFQSWKRAENHFHVGDDTRIATRPQPSVCAKLEVFAHGHVSEDATTFRNKRHAVDRVLADAPAREDRRHRRGSSHLSGRRPDRHFRRVVLPARWRR